MAHRGLRGMQDYSVHSSYNCRPQFGPVTCMAVLPWITAAGGDDCGGQLQGMGPLAGAAAGRLPWRLVTGARTHTHTCNVMIMLGIDSGGCTSTD